MTRQQDEVPAQLVPCGQPGSADPTTTGQLAEPIYSTTSYEFLDDIDAGAP